MKTGISKQTQLVLDILTEKRCHLTADEILESLDGIGKATVYRALDHLTEMGLIRRLALDKKSAVYELVRSDHMHFVCRKCGRVEDIGANFSGMIAEAAHCCGHQVQRSEVTAYGICKDCLLETKIETNFNQI